MVLPLVPPPVCNEKQHVSFLAGLLCSADSAGRFPVVPMSASVARGPPCCGGVSHQDDRGPWRFNPRPVCL